MKTAQLSEKELAAHIISYLRADQYEIFQEVPIGGSAIDIVATRGKLLIVVETKTNLGLDVLEQASSWIGHANLVYCGVPKPKRNQNTFGRKVASKFGIGTIEVNVPRLCTNPDAIVIEEYIHPEFRRNITDRIWKALRSEMMTGKYGEAGTNRGGRYTPFKQTTEALLDVVRKNPGIELKRAIDQIKHHYASNAACRANLKNHIEDRIISGLTYSKEGGKFVLNPVL